MEKIKWCLNIKNGLELVEPNDNLSKVYIQKAEDSLKASAALKDNKDWEISSSYYSMYFGLYSILMKIGIKSENHSCTIEFMKRFLTKYFDKEEIKLISNSMQTRIDAQYYADREIADVKYLMMLKQAPSFLVKCKEILLKIREEEIEELREQIRKIKATKF